MSQNKELIVSKNSASCRLDKFIHLSCKNVSRAFIQNLIKGKKILVNNKVSKASYKVKEDDRILIEKNELLEPRAKKEKIHFKIIFEDKDLIIVNKAQGMVTHPASGVYSGTLVNALLYRCKDSLSGINGVIRPGIVHRLDKDTSGLIIVCKNDRSHIGIANQIKERTLKRYYLAMIYGKLP